MKPGLLLCLWCFGCLVQGFCQRTYTNNSVLSGGDWYKFSVDRPGIYKLDRAFLRKLGIQGGNLNSSSIRLFGNGGQMLPEACNAQVRDDLTENPILVVDGGDGQFNEGDYLLFYAQGPHTWTADSSNKQFNHQRNLYSDLSYYYIQIDPGGNGKRIGKKLVVPSFNTTIQSFDRRYFYEPDSLNFLGSGRQWFGDEFSNNPGGMLVRSYQLNWPAIAVNSPVNIRAACVSRSVGSSSRFIIQLNGQQALQLDMPATTTIPTDSFARASVGQGASTVNADVLNIRFEFSPGSFNAQGWLDWFEIFGRSDLSLLGMKQLSFRDWKSVGPGNVGQFVINNANGAQVWEITDPLMPSAMETAASAGNISFVNDCSRLREYIAFRPDSALIPQTVGKINNQNLHRPLVVDMLVVTDKSLMDEANRLALHHLQRDNLKSLVVTTDQVFNEFSSGTPDPTAIRDFVKMFCDRAGADSTKRPKYLLLFGTGSFDYKSRISSNVNLVPVYESPSSLDPLTTYTSDDYFGFLQDADDINNAGRANLLDIGIGRIPARNVKEAKAYVDKLIQYRAAGSMGPWRNELTFVADDQDFNLHLHDAETIAAAAKSANPLFNHDKIYLDAYQKVGGAGGARYPAANQAVLEEIYNGTLLFNYSGHGGYRRLSEEVILDQDVINSFNNPNKLPLFVTATCDFAPYDDPRIYSIGEDVLLREKTGAIALMTTTRLVFAYSNRVMNQNYIQLALSKKTDGQYRSLGEAVRDAKNFTYQTFGDIANNRKFTLLGDPALRIAFPQLGVTTLLVNGKPVSTTDTLKALQECTISGFVSDPAGNPQQQFNGNLFVSVFDKEQTLTTKGNDPDSYPETFKLQRNLVYRGKASVTNGQFQFRFLIPRDINYQYGKGSISYYAENGSIDASGKFNGFIVGGSGTGSTDIQGPDIRAWLNDEKFVNGGITNETPILILRLQDSSGINILGTGIGHDLEAVLDNDPQNSFILNRFYEADQDNYRKGTVRYQMPRLSGGKHFLKIRAWDAANNSSEIMLEFMVQQKEELVLSHVLNYPNPFTSRTSFWFEHNHPFEQLQVSVRIFTVTGKLVKTISRTIFSEGNRSTELEWDGRDDYDDKLSRGVYIYILRVRTSEGLVADKIEKLMIL